MEISEKKPSKSFSECVADKNNNGPADRTFSFALEQIDEEAEQKRKSSKKQEESPLMDGPVTGFAFRSALLETRETPAQIDSPKMVQAMILSLKPKLEGMSEKGILHMSVRITSAILKDIVLEIHQYDTAPSAFKITLSGNMQAQKLFISQRQSLEAGLTRALPGMTFNILPPTFPTRKWASRTSSKNSLVKTKAFGYGANQKDGNIL